MMSAWRKKAIECLPDQKREFEDPETSVYGVFSVMLSAVQEAHTENNVVKLKNIYDYAEWCFGQKEKDLWNAAGVSFYEHLGDREETLKGFPQWVKPGIYVEIRGLLELWLKPPEMQELDKIYGISHKRNK